jgi:hypothetical protein
MSNLEGAAKLRLSFGQSDVGQAASLSAQPSCGKAVAVKAVKKSQRKGAKSQRRK